MDMPKLDVNEVGLEWLDDPEQARQAAANDWQDALAVIAHYRLRLQLCLVQAMNEEDEASVKKANMLLRHIKDTLSGIQTLIRSMQH